MRIIGMTLAFAFFLLGAGTANAQAVTAFSATKTSISLGESVALSWNSNQAWCSAQGSEEFNGNVPTVGIVEVKPFASTKYTLICAGQKKTVTISVSTNKPILEPLIRFYPNPVTVELGKPIQLSWRILENVGSLSGGSFDVSVKKCELSRKDGGLFIDPSEVISGNGSTVRISVIPRMKRSTYRLACAYTLKDSTYDNREYVTDATVAVTVTDPRTPIIESVNISYPEGSNAYGLMQEMSFIGAGINESKGWSGVTIPGADCNAVSATSKSFAGVDFYKEYTLRLRPKRNAKCHMIVTGNPHTASSSFDIQVGESAIKQVKATYNKTFWKNGKLLFGKPMQVEFEIQGEAQVSLTDWNRNTFTVSKRLVGTKTIYQSQPIYSDDESAIYTIKTVTPNGAVATTSFTFEWYRDRAKENKQTILIKMEDDCKSKCQYLGDSSIPPLEEPTLSYLSLSASTRLLGNTGAAFIGNTGAALRATQSLKQGALKTQSFNTNNTVSLVYGVPPKFENSKVTSAMTVRKPKASDVKRTGRGSGSRSGAVAN